MRGKIKTLEGSSSLSYAASYPKQRKKDEAKRIDLNDLLKRAEEQKRIDKRANRIIIVGAASVISIAVLIVSL